MRWNNRVLAGAGLLLIQAWQAHAWTVGWARNGTQSLAERAVGGCPAGYTNCEVFGCMEGSDCPQTCSDRGDASSCSFSVNGVGCKWSLDKCIQDLQCNVGTDGSCPDGCQGCGVFQCINLELKCPVPCKYREQDACNTDEMYNGIGCAWNNNRCITWDVINAMPLDGDMVAATEDLSPVPSTAVEEPESSSTSETTSTSSSEEPSEEPSSSESSSEEPSSESSSEESSSESSSEESSTEESSSSEEPTEESSEASSEEPTEEDSSSTDEAAGTSDESSGPNLPVIIGIGAGVLLLIGLISWAVLWYCTKKKKERQQMQARMQMGNANDDYMPPYVDYDAMYRESAYNNDYDDSPQGVSSYNKKSYYTSGFSRNDANKPYQGW